MGISDDHIEVPNHIRHDHLIMEYLEEINMWVKWEKYAIKDNI